MVAPSRAPIVSRHHHELHVAGAAGFEAGGLDLVGNVAGWDQPLGQGHVVIG